MFYGKLYVNQTGPQAIQTVLQLHPSLDLLHRGPIRWSVQIPQCQPLVHWVIVLGPV